MAQFMVRLFPQMLDAMPANMGSLMRWMGRSDAGAAMMTKMMPVMFPKMAPGILGKVMPDMVAEVNDFIGDMPEDMAYLMPDLLPKTMDSLMPSYIPQLIPYLVPLFVEYLHNGPEEPTNTDGPNAPIADRSGKKQVGDESLAPAACWGNAD